MRLDDRPKFRNYAADYLKQNDEDKHLESQASQLKLKMIDDEMRDMLMMSQDTRSAIREMNEAFAGDNQTEYIAEERNNKIKVSKVTRKRTLDRLATAKTRALEPIMEETNNRYAIVPVDDKEQRKKRN